MHSSIKSKVFQAISSDGSRNSNEQCKDQKTLICNCNYVIGRLLIFDNTAREAFSNVVQRVSPWTAVVETLLDSLALACRFDKIMILEFTSKICLCSDTQHMDSRLYDLVADIIDTSSGLCGVYGGGVSVSTDAASSCTVTLSNGQVLGIKLIDDEIVLAYLLHQDNAGRSFFVEQNLEKFKRAMMTYIADDQ